MSQSVKLSDGSYIDAGAVWDASQSKTQEEINTASSINLSPYLEGAGITNYDASYLFKLGKLISLSVYFMTPKAYPAFNVVFTLPEGWRPSVPLHILAIDFSGNLAPLTLQPDGNVLTSGEVAEGVWILGLATYITN